MRAFLTRHGKNGAPFDLVLADPPYDLGGAEVTEVLAALAWGWLASPGWTVALTRRKGSSTPVIPVDWVPSRRLAYGDTLVVIFREVAETRAGCKRITCELVLDTHGNWRPVARTGRGLRYP